MATDGQRSYVTFLYDDIQWTDSGRALAGINGSDCVRSVTLPGSGSEDIRNLTTTSNVGMEGVWILRVESEGKLTLHLCISSVMILYSLLLCIHSTCKLYFSLSTALDFQFSQEVVSVAEENGTVIICMEMASDGNLFRNVELRVVSKDGNATGNYSCSVSMLFMHSPSL